MNLEETRSILSLSLSQPPPLTLTTLTTTHTARQTEKSSQKSVDLHGSNRTATLESPGNAPSWSSGMVAGPLARLTIATARRRLLRVARPPYAFGTTSGDRSSPSSSVDPQKTIFSRVLTSRNKLATDHNPKKRNGALTKYSRRRHSG